MFHHVIVLEEEGAKKRPQAGYVLCVGNALDFLKHGTGRIQCLLALLRVVTFFHSGTVPYSAAEVSVSAGKESEKGGLSCAVTSCDGKTLTFSHDE